MKKVRQRKPNAKCNLYVKPKKYNKLVNKKRSKFTDIENKLLVTSVGSGGGSVGVRD